MGYIFYLNKVNKNMNLVSKVKDKWDKRKFKRLNEEVTRLRGEIAGIQDQQETLKMAKITTNCVEDKCYLTIKKKSETYVNKKSGHTRGEESPYNKKSDDICEEGIAKRICNINKYRLREGNEREWIEKIKVLMEQQHKKTLEQQLTELMPLVRNHRDITNAIKAKRIAVRRNLDGESVRKFLGRLSKLYGQNRNKTLNKHGNRRIKCHKCKKRGHLRKNCLKNGIGN